MTENQAIIELARKAKLDASLHAALQNVKSINDIMKIAADAGVALSIEDCQVLQRQVAEGELSDTDLERAAGGYLPYFEGLNTSTGNVVRPEHWRL